MQTTSPIREVLTASTGVTSDSVVEHRLAPDVLLVTVWDGSSRLINLSGACYGLPVISTMLLEITLQQGLDEAVRTVAARYDVSTERVRADFEVFLRDLSRQGLLTRPAQEGCRPRLLGRLATRPLAGALRVILRTFRSDTRRAKALLAFACTSLKLLGWAKTIKLWQEACVAPADARPREAELVRLESIHRVVREALSRSILPADCKARALCCWAMLRSAGHSARLVVGIDLFPFLGHCWCECGTQVLGDGGDRTGRFMPVLQYS
jgi:Transglutaminase-like superfamily